MDIFLNIGNKPALLRSSDNCYELCFQRSQKGVETWTPEKYYSTLSGAFTALLEMKIRASTATSVLEVKKAIEVAICELQSEYRFKVRIESDVAG